MRHLAGTAISLREICQTLFRHKKKIALVAILILAIASGITLFIPRVYRSQAKLLIRLGRENAALDPTVTFGQAPVVAVPSSREDDVNSALEILTSRFLLERVVDAIGAQAILGRVALRADQVGRPPDPETPSQGDGDVDRPLAIAKLARKLDVASVKKSNILTISYDGPSPEVSQAVVNRLIDSYIERYAHLHRTPGAHHFLSEQTMRLKTQLNQTEESLRTLKDRTGVYSPEGQRQLLVARLGLLEDELLRTMALKAATEAEVKALRARLAQLPKTQVLSSTTGFPNAVAELMRGQIFSLALKELDLLARHGEAHREVELGRKQLATAQEALTKEERGRDQVTVGPNRAYEDAELSLLRQEVQLASLQAKAVELLKERDQEQAALQQFNRSELDISRLQRELELQSVQYRKYADNLEQAEIDRELETGRLSNISLVQPATYDAEPVRPRPLLYMGLAAMIAVVAGCGLAVVAENLDHTLKTPEDVEAVLGLPVVASLPVIRRRWPVTNGTGRIDD
jgi:polysaccharide biosynthesis protein PslE